MAELKLEKLPDRTPVKLTITITPTLHAKLARYADAYEALTAIESRSQISFRSCLIAFSQAIVPSADRVRASQMAGRDFHRRRTTCFQLNQSAFAFRRPCASQGSVSPRSISSLHRETSRRRRLVARRSYSLTVCARFCDLIASSRRRKKSGKLLHLRCCTAHRKGGVIGGISYVVQCRRLQKTSEFNRLCFLYGSLLRYQPANLFEPSIWRRAGTLSEPK